MKVKIVSISFSLIGILILLLSIKIGGTEITKEIHKDCKACHSTEDFKIKIEINELCLKCHSANRNDHPIGVVSKWTPARLPLDKENKLTCITCHEPHGKDTVNKLLRMDPDSLCLSCHKFET